MRVGTRAVPSLVARLGDARPDRAAIYVDLLREIGSPDATPILLDELGRGRLPEEAIVDALGAMLRAGDKRPMVTVVALLAAPSGLVRRHAAEALRGPVDARAASALASATSDDEREVRVIAIGELGRLGAREALPRARARAARQRRGDGGGGGARAGPDRRSARRRPLVGALGTQRAAGAARGCRRARPRRRRAAPRSRCCARCARRRPIGARRRSSALGGVVRRRARRYRARAPLRLRRGQRRRFGAGGARRARRHGRSRRRRRACTRLVESRFDDDVRRAPSPRSATSAATRRCAGS